MKLLRQFTGERLLTCFRRFPATVSVLVALTIFLLAFIANEDVIVSERFTGTTIFLLSSSTVVSLALHLWGEDRQSRRTWLVQLGLGVLWVAFVLWQLWTWPPTSRETIALFAGCLLTVVALFVVPFLRRPTDLASWNFTHRVAIALLVPLLVGLILNAGLVLLLVAFENLFGASLSFRSYTSVAVVVWCFLVPLLFLMQLPAGAEKHDESAQNLSRFGRGIIYYLLLPLTAAYLLTLYVYAVKILVQWTLPIGWVSWLVSVSMLAVVVLIALLYPTQFESEHRPSHRFDAFVRRYLPLLLLPLLLLMSVGIARRLSDYGLTVSRLYLLLFNGWCYVVCIVLFLTRGRRIAWVAMSFAVLLFVASVGPWSFSQLTLRTLQGELRAAMVKSGFEKQLPLDEATYEKWLRGLDARTAEKMSSKMSYLAADFDSVGVAGLLKSEDIAWRVSVDTGSVKTGVSYDADSVGVLSVPKEFTRFADTDMEEWTVQYPDKVVRLELTVRDGDRQRHFVYTVPRAEVMRLSDRKEPWILRNDSSEVVVRSAYFNFGDGRDYISAYLFFR